MKKKLKGDGIIDWAKNAYNVIRDPSHILSKTPKQVSESLMMYGDFKVIKIIIGREKVERVVQYLFNAITLGNFNREKEKYGYDDIFHLFAILVLDNGKKLITERNQRIVLMEDTVNRDNVIEKIAINTNIKLSQLFQNAIKADGDRIWRYDSINNNCQHFIASLLRNSGYLTPEASSFISQNVDNLFNPIIKNIAQTSTDIVAIFDNIIKGGAMKKKLTIKEIKTELKRLKVKGITGKTKPELLEMLNKSIL